MEPATEVLQPKEPATESCLQHGRWGVKGTQRADGSCLVVLVGCGRLRVLAASELWPPFMLLLCLHVPGNPGGTVVLCLGSERASPTQ